MLIAFVVGWGLRQLGVAATAASLWAFSFSLMPGVAALLSGSQADLLRAVWPREAVDWLAWASLLFTGVAVVQFRGYQRRWHWTTVVLGLLLGIGVVCRLLYGSIYLRPGQTSWQALLAIFATGSLLGLGWSADVTRQTARSWQECLVTCIWIAGISVTLAMSGSLQYGVIGGLIGLATLIAWVSTGYWPWVSGLIMGSLLGLGWAFAELRPFPMFGLTLVWLGLMLTGRLPQEERGKRLINVVLVICAAMIVCVVGWTANQFLNDTQRSNTDYGGYETLK